MNNVPKLKIGLLMVYSLFRHVLRIVWIVVDVFLSNITKHDHHINNNKTESSNLDFLLEDIITTRNNYLENKITVSIWGV